MSNAIVKTVSNSASKIGFQLKKHGPDILVVAGIVGLVGSAVLACKATTKASAIIEEAKDDIEKIHQVANDESVSVEEYSEEDHKKDLVIAYTQTGVKLAKVYAPAIGLGVLSIAGILGGHNILRKRNFALAAAYTTIDKSFKEYRSRVVDRFGKEVDQELRYDLKAKKITETVTDENGKEKKVKKTVLVPSEGGVYSGYARSFEPGCPCWENDPQLNLAFLKTAESYFNDVLDAKGYVFLSSVYSYLGYRETDYSRVVGWRRDEMNPDIDNHIDFGFRNNEAFMNGDETNVILDFNVDGVILYDFEDSYCGSEIC